MTKKAARETIEAYKDMTAWFNNECKHEDMYNMFRYRMGFGEAESRIMIAALVAAGAKFSK